jgi:hypothetical protein
MLVEKLQIPSEEDFDILEAYYGSHTSAALALGISQRNYRRIRNEGTGHPMTLRVIADEARSIKIRAGLAQNRRQEK